MCTQVYGYASLDSMGRKAPRRFHIVQECLGARRRATPPLGGLTPSGSSCIHPLTQRLLA
eukprot:3436246-Pyramimonas_sp.AAC.1